MNKVKKSTLDTPSVVEAVGDGISITDLVDIPGSFSGQSNRYLRVKLDESAMEFSDMVISYEYVGHKSLSLGYIDGSSENDVNADGGGIILMGDSNKEFIWDIADNKWHSNIGMVVNGDAHITGDVSSDTEIQGMVPIGGIIPWHKSIIAMAGTMKKSGTANTDTITKLIDTTADFVTAGVVAGDIVRNSTDTQFAIVITVDSATTLTLDWDCFPDGNENYYIYDEPTLSERFVECNGQTISDAESPLNGLNTPNLNSDLGQGFGGNFIRASKVSGRDEDWSIENITGAIFNAGFKPYGGYPGGGVGAFLGHNSGLNTHSGEEVNPPTSTYFSFDASRVVKTSTETRPSNISMVYIMRIK